MNQTTVLICAKNAEFTIRNALLSAVKTNNEQKILLVDDFSEDSTIAKAEELSLKHLTVVQPRVNIEEGIGNARQTALENLTTPYGIWLDADDEFLPNRVEKMEEMLRADDLDILFDSAVLFDGSTDQKIRDLIIPQNLFQEDGELFLFHPLFVGQLMSCPSKKKS